MLFTIIPKMVEHYHFLKSPVTFEDTNLDKGMVFEGGVWEDTVVEEVRVYFNGLLIATGESTDRCEAVFQDMMSWWVSEVGLTFDPTMVGEKVYISQVVIRSAVELDRLNPAVAAVVSSFFKGPTGFANVGFFTGGDPNSAPVKFERAVGAPGLPPAPDEYWTQSPLPTSSHLEFVAAFEKALAG